MYKGIFTKILQNEFLPKYCKNCPNCGHMKRKKNVEYCVLFSINYPKIIRLAYSK